MTDEASEGEPPAMRCIRSHDVKTEEAVARATQTAEPFSIVTPPEMEVGAAAGNQLRVGGRWQPSSRQTRRAAPREAGRSGSRSVVWWGWLSRISRKNKGSLRTRKYRLGLRNVYMSHS